MHKTAWVWLAAAMLVTGGCASSPSAPPARPAEHGPSVNLVEAVRLAYDRGFRQLADALPQQASDSPLVKVQQVKDFRQRWVRWAALDGRAYRALEGGYTNGAWLVVVPPGHDMLAQMVATLQVRLEVDPPLTVLLIRPELVSERWAGIFMVHELSHLRDRLYELEPLTPTREEFLQAEMRAYEVELLAASFLSQGEIERQMDALLVEWKPSSPEDLVERVRHISAADLSLLEAAMQGPPAASRAESTLRGGFYIMAFSLRYARTLANGQEVMLATIDRLLRDTAAKP